MRNLLRNILAVTLGLGLLLAAEGVLFLAGVTPLADEDPFVGFKGSEELFIPGEPGYYTLNPSKERYFNRQTFPADKAADSFRIIAFGGSTTYGRPYLGNTSFAAWFERLLERYDGVNQYERINAGGISYASYRVTRLMQEMLQFSPDLYVVYSGHNEFLEARTFADLIEEAPALRSARSLLYNSRIYSVMHRTWKKMKKGEGAASKTVLDGVVSARLEDVGGTDLYHRDPEFKAGVLQQYRHSIMQMVTLSKENGVPLILCTLPSNLSGVSPFKSEHRDNITAEELLAWNQAFNDAERALLDNRPDEALSLLENAEKIDDQYALLHYRKAQALHALARFEQAYTSFVKAKQEDIVPLRALDEFNEILREIAAAEQVPLADVEAMFRRVSPDGIPGNNLFVDHVHPTIEGQQMVAWVIMNTAVKWGLVPLKEARWQEKMVDARQYLFKAEQDISPRYRSMGLWGVGRVFFWAGKYPEAYVALQQAWQTVKDVPDIPRKLGRLELYQGNGQQALAYLKTADNLEPGNVSGLIALARAHLMLGDADRALSIVNPLVQSEPDNPTVHWLEGKVLRSMGRHSEGLEGLARAAKLATEVPRYQADLAMALAESQQLERAETHYRKYLDLIRHPLPERELIAWRQQFIDLQSGRVER